MSIKRIFVEKKRGHNIEASDLFADIKENLGIEGLDGVRILNRYDCEDLNENYFEDIKNTIFSEPPVDNVYDEQFPVEEDEKLFAVEYLPGQYDQRADSAMQCVQIVTGEDMPLISAAKVYVLKGKLSEDDIDKIKKYCVNPVDSRIADLKKPASLKIEHPVPKDVKIFDGFKDKTDDEIRLMRKELGLAMSDEDLIFCRNYFRDTEKRNPSVTEIKVIDTYWSDHCRHTTFAAKLENIVFEDGYFKDEIEGAYNTYIEERKKLKRENKKICLMDIAQIGMKALRAAGKLDNLDESEEINACSINIDVDVDGRKEQWLLMFKNETHNHPTEIEPFGGAATCLGGAIRDPLSGRSYVYQAMRVTGCADPTVPVSETLHGKLPQRKLTTGAAQGYSSYGNQIGLATGQVSEIYDEGYAAKRMEIGAVIGAAKKENVIRKKPIKGDIVILVGGRTGRDGCGGATGSSKEHTEESILSCGAEVQKGNPPTERKLQRLFRNPEASRMIKRCNDFGAGGVSVAIGELAEGLEINLDLVPKKYDGLDGTELAISESQERMAVVLDKKDEKRFRELADSENLESAVVARITDDRRLKMFWRSKDIVNISRDFLDTNGAEQRADVYVSSPPNIDAEENVTDIKKEFIDNLKKLNVACQKGLVERFDSTIGAGTVLMPFGGKNQLTPIESMAAKIPVPGGETSTVTLMSYGYDPSVAKKSPYHAAAYAVTESIAKIVASGGKYSSVRLTFQEYFEKLGDNPKSWGKPFAALLGALKAQLCFGTPAIGGKDSMSGTFMDLNVPPALVSFAVDIAKADNIISPEFKRINSKIIKIKARYDNYKMPVFEYLKAEFDKVSRLIREKKAISAATIGKGGICAAVAKMCFGNGIGADINTDKFFNAEYGSFIIEAPEDIDIQQELAGIDYEIMGHTNGSGSITVNGVQISIDEALKAWFSKLESVFPTMYFKKKESRNIKLTPFNIKEKKTSGRGIASPRIFIPVFPGTNCEYDTKRAFERAGGIAETLVINNLTISGLEYSIDRAAKMIKDSQIIALAGGFSAGDEPEGSGKFIAAFFRNPKIREAVSELLNNRDGLMLGICNGFQALIKLGLVPWGEIRDMTQDSPTLTFNKIGRHVSCLNSTKIVSNKSPWLWGVNTGDIHMIAFSHGEGRFAADEKIIKELERNGQIATQYTDENGIPSYDIRNNPNGSDYAIEGITSPDGRILGKMGHSERISAGVYKNVSGIKNQKIFESGVNYFR